MDPKSTSRVPEEFAFQRDTNILGQLKIGSGRLRERCTSFEMITFQASYIELAQHYRQRREAWGWTHTLVPTQLCPHICHLQITLSLALGHRLITHHFLKRILCLAPGTLAEDWRVCFVYPLAFK